MSSSNLGSTIRVGPYLLMGRVGQGGSAHVHRAIGPDGESVAVKLLAPQADVEDPGAPTRFEREVRALANLDHPNVVALLDHGIDEELGPYLVTPLVPGKNLRDLIAGRRLCPEAALLLARPIGAALAALHRAGLIHRDIKPENAVAAPDGRVVLVDLGLAYRRGETRYTEEGAVVGSVPYMSPEQIEGREITTATDMWSLGVTIYEWIAGRRPFERERAAEEATAALVGAFAPLSAVDRRVARSLSDLVGECLHAEPGARPTAEALCARIDDEIDWTDEHDAALATVIGDPAAYQEAIAGRRVARLKREARAAIEEGRSFAALKTIDRALAYAPDDPGLDSLHELAESAGRAGAVAARARSRARLLPFAAAVAVAIGAIGVTVYLAADDEEEAAAAPAEVDDRIALLGRFLSVFEVALDRLPDPEPPATAPVEPSRGEPPVIPADQLSNRDPAEPGRLRAAAGEPLVPADHLGQPAASVLADAERSLAEEPDNPAHLLARATALFAAGHTARGREALDLLLRAHVDFSPAWILRGVVEQRAGRFDIADAAFGRASVLDPSSARALRLRGILRLRTGRTRDAHADLRAALRLDPDDLDALTELAAIYDRAGRLPDAAPLLARIAELAPTSPGAWLDLSRVQPPVEALASVRRALTIDAGSPAARARLCALLAEIESPETEEACDRALERRPDDADSLSHRGLARLAKSDARGFGDLDRAVALRPDDPDLLQRRAAARRRAGREADARADLRRACELGADAACAGLAPE